MRRLLTLFLAMAVLTLLTGASCSNTRPEPPEASVVVQKEIVRVEVPVHRPLPSDLVADCKTVPEGKNSEAFTLLAKAREALTECTGRMRQVREKQGTRASD